jgi:hypothetical protein
MPSKKASAARSSKPSSKRTSGTRAATSSTRKATSSKARTSTTSSPKSTVEVEIGEEFTPTEGEVESHVRRPVWEPGETRQQFQKRLEEYKRETGNASIGSPRPRKRSAAAKK